MNVLLRLILIEAFVCGTQAILYFGCELFQKNLHNVKRPIDDKVPRIPWTVIIYTTWFPVIALFPIALYYFNEKTYVIYQIAAIANNVISTICYLIYPTTFEREPAPEKGTGKFLGLIYKASFRGINCAPSLHCASCYTVLVCDLVAITSLPWFLSVIFIALSLGIVISTQTTKQHVLIDLVSAIPLAAVSIIIGAIVSNSVDVASFLSIFGI